MKATNKFPDFLSNSSFWWRTSYLAPSHRNSCLLLSVRHSGKHLCARLRRPENFLEWPQAPQNDNLFLNFCWRHLCLISCLLTSDYTFPYVFYTLCTVKEFSILKSRIFSFPFLLLSVSRHDGGGCCKKQKQKRITKTCGDLAEMWTAEICLK